MPSDLVGGYPMSSYATQQIKTIRQRVLTTSNVVEMARKHGLVDDTGPDALVAESVRSKISLNIVSAEPANARDRTASQGTIAFKISFEHVDPVIAQTITSELVDAFLAENFRSRTELAAGAGEFLKREAESIEAELLGIEREIAQFKEDNRDALPEFYQFNLSGVQRSRAELDGIETRLQALAQRLSEIAVHQSQVSPWKELADTEGEVLMDDRKRLNALQTEYRQKSSVYSATHPDLLRLRREISHLETMLDESAVAAGGERDRVPDNPAYLMLESQKQTVLAEQKTLIGQRDHAEQQLRNFENLLSLSPGVEQEYLALQRNYTEVKARFQDIKDKENSAELSERVELQQKGGRFELLEAASLPVIPTSPNRKALLAVGLVLSLAASLAIVAILEVLDSNILYERQLEAATGVPPFAVVPYIQNSVDRDRAATVRRRLVVAGVTIGLVIVAVNYLVISVVD